MSRFILPGQPIRLKAAETTKALRAGELLDALRLGTGITPGRPLISALRTLIVNHHNQDIPAYGLTHWSGGPLSPAVLGGTVPELVLRTSTDTAKPVCVAIDSIRAAGGTTTPATPAGIGQVVFSGVCWARCRGEIAAGDSIRPDGSFYGMSSTSESNAIALGDVPRYTDAIIPVYIGWVTAACRQRYNLRIWWTPNAGVASISVAYGGVTEVIDLPYNATAAAVAALVNAHAGFVAGGVACEVESVGAFPGANMLVSLPVGATLAHNGHTLLRSPTRPFPDFTVDICGDCR